MTVRGVLNDRPVLFDDEKQCWLYEDDGLMVINTVKPKPTRFGSLLLSARKTLSLSQTQAAELTGISDCSLSQMETGKQNNPTSKMITALHRGYGLSYASMLEALEADHA